MTALQNKKKSLFNLFRCKTTKSNGELPERWRSSKKQDRKVKKSRFLTDLDKDRIGSRPILEGFKKERT